MIPSLSRRRVTMNIDLTEVVSVVSEVNRFFQS